MMITCNNVLIIFISKLYLIRIGKPFCKDNKCDVPYDFKHVLDFTDSGSTFEVYTL